MKERKALHPYLFISYSHDDLLFAEKLQQRLKQDGYDVWIDYDEIRANEMISPEIEKAIYGSTVFLSLLSRSYIQKDFCREEAECARKYKKILMPVHIERVVIPPGSGYHLTFSKSQLGYGSDIVTEDDFEKWYQRLLQGIAHSLHGSSHNIEAEMNISFGALRSNFNRIADKTYASPEIYTELFPSMRMESKWEKQQGEKHILNCSNNNEALFQYIQNHPKEHILIYGDGGSGKSVALKQLFGSLMNAGIPVLYVPMNKVRFASSDALINYIEEIVCRQAGFENIRQLAMNDCYKTRVVLMLDGLNEVTGDIHNVECQIEELMLWDNLQVILTSRHANIFEFHDDLQLRQIHFEPIHRTVILSHLQTQGYSKLSDETLLSLLSNPMMLTLYTQTNITEEYMDQIARSPYGFQYAPIRITRNPDTAGKIIWNYIVSQLYKASKASQSFMDTIHAFVCVELLMPYLAYQMFSQQYLPIHYQTYQKWLRQLKHSSQYAVYEEERIDAFLEYSGLDYQLASAGVYSNIMCRKLCFLKKSESSLEFNHQIFCDFFAALYIAKQIEQMALHHTCDAACYAILSAQIYENEMIAYISDILNESAFMPQMSEKGIVFPGKSLCEQSLSLFRHRYGEDVQKLNANLFAVMKYGRKKKLSNCDFSDLDLRLCHLGNTQFVSWQHDQLYPSSFRGAYLDIGNFISQGHACPISAICADGEELLSADIKGNVKRWSLRQNQPIETLDAVIDAGIIEMMTDGDYLMLLSAHGFYRMHMREKTVEELAQTHHYYKYMKRNEKGEYLLSSDSEPFTWRNIATGELIRELDFDVTCGCIAKHPQKEAYIFGLLYNNAMHFEKQEDGYCVHRRIDLRSSHAHITDVCYHADGSRFLVANTHGVSEYDSETLELLHYTSFDARLYRVMYHHDRIVAASGFHLIVLNPDFSLYRRYPGRRTNHALSLRFGDRLYLCSNRNHVICFDDAFRVHRMRHLPPNRLIAFGKNRNRKECLILVNPENQLNPVSTYDFNTAAICNVFCDYEIVNEAFRAESFPYDITKIEDVIYFTKKGNPQEQLRFVYHPGIEVYGCDFKDVKGTIVDYLDLIQIYGGIV